MKFSFYQPLPVKMLPPAKPLLESQWIELTKAPEYFAGTTRTAGEKAFAFMDIVCL